jgi:hypothetical protein
MRKERTEGEKDVGREERNVHRRVLGRRAPLRDISLIPIKHGYNNREKDGGDGVIERGRGDAVVSDLRIRNHPAHM